MLTKMVRHKAPAGADYDSINVGTIRGKYTPVGHPNLIANLSALNLSSITKDGSNKVSAWADTVGARIFAAATAALQPTYAATGWDGVLPCLTFDGALNGNVLQYPGSGLARDNSTILIACQRAAANDDAGATDRPLITASAANGKFFTLGGRRVGFEATQTRLYLSSSGTGAVSNNATGFGIGEKHVVLGQIVSGGTTTNVGVDDKTPAVGALGTTTSTNFDIGGTLSTPSRRFGGKIAQILIFDSVLTGDDLAKNVAYLEWQWGMQANLQNNNPYALVGPIAA